MLDGLNLSVLAIPANWLVINAAHAYGVGMVRRRLGRWDNVNPRSPESKKVLREKLGPDVYACYERAKGAHNNGLENMPLFAAAVILGNMAKLPAEGFDGMAGFAVTYVVLRALYSVVYIRATRNKTSYIRTVLFVSSVGLCLRKLIQAAYAM